MRRFRRLAKRIRKETLKKRRKKATTSVAHINRYKHLAGSAGSAKKHYDPINKRLRNLQVTGKPGTYLQRGMIVMYHGRRYSLLKEVYVPEDGRVRGDFKLVGYTGT